MDLKFQKPHLKKKKKRRHLKGKIGSKILLMTANPKKSEMGIFDSSMKWMETNKSEMHKSCYASGRLKLTKVSVNKCNGARLQQLKSDV